MSVACEEKKRRGRIPKPSGILRNPCRVRVFGHSCIELPVPLLSMAVQVDSPWSWEFGQCCLGVYCYVLGVPEDARPVFSGFLETHFGFPRKPDKTSPRIRSFSNECSILFAVSNAFSFRLPRPRKLSMVWIFDVNSSSRIRKSK